MDDKETVAAQVSVPAPALAPVESSGSAPAAVPIAELSELEQYKAARKLYQRLYMRDYRKGIRRKVKKMQEEK